MPSALSSPRPAARISRANSTPPRPMKRCAVMRPWNSSMTPSTSSGSTEPEAHELAGERLDLARPELGQQDAGLLLLIWARKTAALRRPGSSGRGGAGGAAADRARGVPPQRRRSCSTREAMRHALFSLNQPRSIAATSSGRSLTMVEISPRTFCRSAASSSMAAVSILGRASSRTLWIAEALELGEHVVAELERLVVLLDVAAARASAARRGGRRGRCRPRCRRCGPSTTSASLASASRAASMSAAAASAAVVSNGIAATVIVVPAGVVQADGGADEVAQLLLVQVAGDGVVHDDRDGQPVDGARCALLDRRRGVDGVVRGRRLLVVRGVAAGGRRRRRACSPGRGRRRPGCRSRCSSRSWCSPTAAACPRCSCSVSDVDCALVEVDVRAHRDDGACPGRGPGRGSCWAFAARRFSVSCSTCERASPAAAVMPGPGAPRAPGRWSR